MDPLLPLLVDVWQQVGRNLHLAAAAEGVATAVTPHLPLQRLLIRQLDPGRRQLLTLAATGAGGSPMHDEQRLTSSSFERLRTWCEAQQMMRGSAEALRERLPGLVPEGLSGAVLAAGLAHEGKALGAVIVIAVHSEALGAEHEPVLAALLEPLAVALENDRLIRELAARREAAEADRSALLARMGRREIGDTVVGANAGLRAVMQRVELVAQTDAPVVILGETGSGKELVARAIHRWSARAGGPFLRVNCGAIPPELADSELFGHERGSFTGASAQRKGWFERADHGTLFLDEIGELSAAVQVRLLRILQDGTFQRVGGQQELHVDVRVVAATHRDLAAMVQDGHFRADLWYRINVFPIDLPALRERPTDIAALAEHFAERAAIRLGLPLRRPTPEDIGLLTAYRWPGNVRELASVIERAAILGNGGPLEIATALGAGLPLLEPRTEADAEPQPLPESATTLEALVRARIETALAQAHGRVEGPFGAARQLAINPNTLRARMRKLGIDWRRYRSDAR